MIHELRMRCNRYDGTVEQLSYTLDYISSTGHDLAHYAVSMNNERSLLL